MKCPFCSEGETRVLETRNGTDFSLWRRRVCMKPECGKRFTTCESQKFILQLAHIEERLRFMGFTSKKIEQILGVEQTMRQRKPKEEPDHEITIDAIWLRGKNK
jgi:transcriptional regulator NrdR family protein